MVAGYLQGNPFRSYFDIAIPYGFPEHLRVEHAVVVAGTGGGKTQLIENLILADLDADDPCSMVIIDSKTGENSLLHRISRLDEFNPRTGRLRDRIIIIDPKDKPALNMFDVDAELVTTKINEVAALIRYFLSSLLGNELSNQMNVLFLPLLHIILRKKGATLHDFVDVVKNPHQYPEIIDQLPRGPKAFIWDQYNDPVYRVTKSSIITRLYEIINESTLDDMFSAPRNAIKLSEALNVGKIVLVSTDAAGLQHLSPLFGRWFIAQVMNAGLARASVPGKKRPIHFYIDECAPYVDDKLSDMLTTIRSYGIGLLLAFQGTWQMGSHHRAIQGNTAIKLMGSVEEVDAKAFASDMRTTPDFIMQQGKARGGNPTHGNLACYTRDLPSAISVQNPFGELDKRQWMSERDYQQLRRENKVRVGSGDVPLLLAPSSSPPPSPPAPPAKPKRQPAGRKTPIKRAPPKNDEDDPTAIG